MVPRRLQSLHLEGEAVAPLESKGSAWITTCKGVNKNKHKCTTTAKKELVSRGKKTMKTRDRVV